MRLWHGGSKSRRRVWESHDDVPTDIPLDVTTTMIQRLLATSLARTARPALHAPCRIHHARYQRLFSNTPRAQVDNNLAAFTAAFQKTSVFKKLANYPEAIKALEELTVTLQESGTLNTILT